MKYVITQLLALGAQARIQQPSDTPNILEGGIGGGVSEWGRQRDERCIADHIRSSCIRASTVDSPQLVLRDAASETRMSRNPIGEDYQFTHVKISYYHRNTGE